MYSSTSLCQFIYSCDRGKLLSFFLVWPLILLHLTGRMSVFGLHWTEILESFPEQLVVLLLQGLNY